MTIDMLGKACPIPVIETRKVIESLQGDEIIHVLVDNEAACGNLGKMAASYGFPCQSEKEGEGLFRVTIQAGKVEKGKLEEQKEGTVVAIGKNTMGQGDDDLGKILAKGFIYSLRELPTPPSVILFFNGGIHFVCEGSNALEDLQAMETLGTKIYVCGTCVDFYKAKEQVRVGEIVNMYAIVTEMNQAERIITM